MGRSVRLKLYYRRSRMQLKSFAKEFNEYIKEIGVNSSEEGYIGSHKIVGDIKVTCENAEDNEYFELIRMDLEQLMGCGCASGIEIIIRKIKE